METIRVRGQDVAVDIRTELERFNWVRPKWSNDKLIAASPFRYDKTPSFFVNFTGQYAGCWGDSGHYDSDWASGNFTKLLSFLRNETYEETEEYLIGEYGVPLSGTDTVKLRPVNLRIQRVRQSLSTGILVQYAEDYTYLLNRGISEHVQRQMGVLYDSRGKAAVIPWRLANGVLANVKFRKTYGKVFWYAKDAWPIRQLVYGIENVGKTAVICEAEIDKMSWMEAGFDAVATGGSTFNEWKRDLILRSPIEELIIATDNDKAGGKLRREIEAMMRGHVRLRHAYVCAGNNGEAKDANEALVKYGIGALREAVERSEGCDSLYAKLRTLAPGK